MNSTEIPLRDCGCPINQYHRRGCPSAPQYGFTGRGDDLSAEQARCLRWLISEADAQTLHLGDAPGSDQQAAEIAGPLGATVVIHPDRSDSGDRNRDIVDACDALWAAPPTDFEIEDSGTWSTIRYAREAGRRLTIIWPDGSTAYEDARQAG